MRLFWKGIRVQMVVMVVLHLIPGQPTAAAEGGSVPQFPARPLIVGHRGAAGLAPENTLAAFALAVELGVDAIELDVLLSADGEPVVHHDVALKPETTRTPDGNWVKPSQAHPIMRLPIDRLKTYDVGRLQPGTPYASRFPEQQPVDGERIPTLREVIALLKQKAPSSLALWIEIKTAPSQPDLTPPPQTVADQVARVVRSKKFTRRTRILSFDWRTLVRIQETAPEIRTVYLTSRYKQFTPFRRKRSLLWTAGFDPADFGGSLPRTIRAAGGRYWGAKYTELSAERIQEAHDAGVAVYAWTVDSLTEMKHLQAIGVDGIITNRPDLLKSVLK